MSNKTIEFHFDFGSPTSYLAYTQLPRIARETGATLVYHPMLLGGVFKATGNASPVSVPAKGRWMGQDIARWAKRWGVPFAFNPHFPINTLTLMRGAVGCSCASRRLPALCRCGLPRHVGCAAQLGDAEELSAVLVAAGFDRRRSRRWPATPRSRPGWSPTPRPRWPAACSRADLLRRRADVLRQDRLDFVREAAAA